MALSSHSILGTGCTRDWRGGRRRSGSGRGPPPAARSSLPRAPHRRSPARGGPLWGTRSRSSPCSSMTPGRRRPACRLHTAWRAGQNRTGRGTAAGAPGRCSGCCSRGRGRCWCHWRGRSTEGGSKALAFGVGSRGRGKRAGIGPGWGPGKRASGTDGLLGWAGGGWAGMRTVPLGQTCRPSGGSRWGAARGMLMRGMGQEPSKALRWALAEAAAAASVLGSAVASAADEAVPRSSPSHCCLSWWLQSRAGTWYTQDLLDVVDIAGTKACLQHSKKGTACVLDWQGAHYNPNTFQNLSSWCLLLNGC